MFSEEELTDWYLRHGVSEAARSEIDRIRASDPARRVRSGRGNVSGRYASQKMGVVIQFESHRGELAAIYEMEHDRDVKWYCDQPNTFRIEYERKDGRRQVVLHTPDYFAIRTDRAEWVECKTEEQLIKLAEESPNRYCCDADGQWHCPPGEAYAEQFGFHYRVRSSKEINWIFQRNFQFLEDYLRADTPAVRDESREFILGLVATEKNIKLEDLFSKTEGITSRDDIFNLIAIEEIYVDLGASPLVEPEKVRVFPDKETAIAYAHAVETEPDFGTPRPRFVELVVGASVVWGDQALKIVNVGEGMVGLVGEDKSFREVPVVAFEELVKAGRITGVVAELEMEEHAKAVKLFTGATPSDFRVANKRAELVHRDLEGQLHPEDYLTPARTRRFWKARYLEAQAKYGKGYLGLLPRTGHRETGDSRLPDSTWIFVGNFIENDYETLKQKKKYEVWAALKNACDKAGVIAPSYKTFIRAIKRRPKYLQFLKRQGRRAAYQHQAFYWTLDQTTPRHGDRPFEIAHIDHTEIDLELPCSQTGRSLGRAWLTILTDAHSRRFLALYLTFDPPSYRSCLMVLRECVRRYGRLPQIVVVDGGKEFHSIYFETFCARYEITKKHRPPAEARCGSVGERLFGTLNTQFFHNLRGNTQITRNVRQMTKSNDPKKQATWTIGRLYARLCEYAFEIYDTIDHPALGQTPREAFAAGRAKNGNRNHRLIAYDEDFKMATLPTSRKGTAKVVSNQGIKINHIYYWNDVFRDPEIESTDVNVRYDPFDVGIAYAFVRNQWVRCISEYYSVFQGHSEKELMQATEQLHARKRKHSEQFLVTAKKLADFLESVEAEEALLTQRLRDRETGDVRRAINGDGATSAEACCVAKDGNADESPGDADDSDDDTGDSEIFEEF